MSGFSVLFTRSDSIYKRMGFDCWDLERDALNWPGGCPVIAHPPCRTWSALSHMATRAREGEKELAPWAVRQVQRWGGVLEHPARSKLFTHCGLPRAGEPPDQYGGIVLLLNQWHWGHRASKPTKLYIVGASKLPPRPVRKGIPTHCVGRSKGVRIGHPKFKPEITKPEREETPPDFARWLVQIVENITGVEV